MFAMHLVFQLVDLLVAKTIENPQFAFVSAVRRSLTCDSIVYDDVAGVLYIEVNDKVFVSHIPTEMFIDTVRMKWGIMPQYIKPEERYAVEFMRIT